MEISTATPGIYFTIFYLLAFAFIFTMVIVFSVRRGYHLRSVLLMIATITLLTIIGTRLFTIPINDWGAIISSDSTINYNNRSAIGGLLFGLIGLLISQRMFGFKRPILDLYAWVVPIGLGIQKIGCFMNGCCFGKPSELIWTVQYPVGTNAHFYQWSSGTIGLGSDLTTSIHPVQLYEMLLLFIIAYIIWKTHNYWKKNASSILFGFFLFFTFRFFIEFIRDPNSSQFNQQYLLGIRTFQWLMLALGMMSGLVLLFYEKYLKIEIIKDLQSPPNLRIDVFYILFISVILLALNGLFSKFELITLWLFFFPAIVLTIYYFYTDSRVKRYRLLVSVLFLVPLYVLSQSTQLDTTAVKKFKQIDLGGSFGSIYNEVHFDPHQSECGTSYDSQYFKHLYSVGGIGISQITEKNKSRTTLGVNLHAGTIKTTSLETNEEESTFTYGINPYAKIDGKWIGAGFGFQVGDLRKISNETIEASEVSDAQKSYVILPEFHFRLGPRHILDAEYNYGFLFPSPYPILNQSVSIGSGFSKKADYSLRLGYLFPLNTNFISAKGFINDQFGLNLMYIFKEQDDYSGHDSSGKFVFGLNYRFGYKNK